MEIIVKKKKKTLTLQKQKATGARWEVGGREGSWRWWRISVRASIKR
jgi:hypothetical protein